ncbi:Mov34/MPN/PAD-1 family protein [Candidatus Bathyarchaeota archaeon]|nr:Mov34/MPN/PAD-1 family protein [Candidatus Bathyarchaeota archaeon]
MADGKPIVVIPRSLLEALLDNAKRIYPKETILLLRGEKSRGRISVSEVIVPPLATYGEGFANIPLHMLPIDFSIIGTVHSHPSGSLKPSPQDLNHFWGSILMILGFPFRDEDCVAVYDYNGNRLTVKVVEH